MKKIIYSILTILLFSCTEGNKTDVYQSNRDNNINVKKNIKEIVIDDFPINRWPLISIYDEYFVICEPNAADLSIHFFDRMNYKHIVSFGRTGQGPEEITNMFGVAYNSEERELYVSDEGKAAILAFPIDSMLKNNIHAPYEKYKMSMEALPLQIFYKNDTMSYCRVMVPTGEYTFDCRTAILNMKKNENIIIGEKQDEESKFILAVSLEDNMYAECNTRHDVVSIFDLGGHLQKKIHGPQRDEKDLECFGSAVFTKNYLVATYNGELYDADVPVTQCVVFEKSGDYIATLETGYSVTRMCYDDKKDRIIFSFDDVIEFGYLDLEEIGL